MEGIINDQVPLPLMTWWNIFKYNCMIWNSISSYSLPPFGGSEQACSLPCLVKEISRVCSRHEDIHKHSFVSTANLPTFAHTYNCVEIVHWNLEWNGTWRRPLRHDTSYITQRKEAPLKTAHRGLFESKHCIQFPFWSRISISLPIQNLFEPDWVWKNIFFFVTFTNGRQVLLEEERAVYENILWGYM